MNTSTSECNALKAKPFPVTTRHLAGAGCPTGIVRTVAPQLGVGRFQAKAMVGAKACLPCSAEMRGPAAHGDDGISSTLPDRRFCRFRLCDTGGLASAEDLCRAVRGGTIHRPKHAGAGDGRSRPFLCRSRGTIHGRRLGRALSLQRYGLPADAPMAMASPCRDRAGIDRMVLGGPNSRIYVPGLKHADPFPNFGVAADPMV